jgi:arginine-tRNA-protein transferase
MDLTTVPYPACAYPALPPPATVRLVTFPEQKCSYLPGRLSMTRAFYAGRMPAMQYQAFMDAGFRRSGHVIYQPVCRGCRACLPIRVPVATFQTNKALRRCRRRNHDLAVAVGLPAINDEKADLYRRYQIGWHGKHETIDEESISRESLESFLYETPVDSLEFTYRDSTGRLLAVGICDVCIHSVSSVYFFFDPAETRRGLGNFGALVELDYATAHGIPYWYLGYWVKGCRAMEYKANFRPHEILHPDGIWREE